MSKRFRWGTTTKTGRAWVRTRYKFRKRRIYERYAKELGREDREIAKELLSLLEALRIAEDEE